MPVLAFPANVLGITVEILLNGTWNDISQYVYQRDDIVIQYGRPNQTSQIQPASIAMTLNNRGGDFSPKNSAGQFYPYIGRNVQLRLSINSESANLTTYSGYRFWGEVSEWPPQWDVSGNDLYVQIHGNGVLERYVQGNTLGSSLKRFYLLKTDATAPVALWTCEELTGASQFNSALPSGSPMTWTGSPTLSSDANFQGADPIPLISNSVWTGNTGSYSVAGTSTFSTPGTYPWLCPGGITSLTSAECWGASGGAGNVAASIINNGSNGGNSTFPGDAVTVTAHGSNGSAGVSGTNGTGTAGGTGSANTTHHDGGAGANAGLFTGLNNGGGGAGSGGTAASGNAGTAGSSGGAGAAAVTGGSTGGNGLRQGFVGHQGGAPGGGPGGSGGANGASGGVGGGEYAKETSVAVTPGKVYNVVVGAGGPGGNGSGGIPGAGGQAGKVVLTYSSATTPNNVILRFLLDIPANSTPADGATLVRGVIASGALTKIECYYSTASGGKLSIRGYNGVTLKFDSAGSGITGVAGNQLMVSLELATSGANLAWKIDTIKPGATSSFGSATGTFTTATIGAMSQVVVAPNADINDTAVGVVVLQYALENLTYVSDSINGHDVELVTDRIARLCSEEGLTFTPVYNETKDHWGFESGTQSWTAASNCTIAQTTYSNPGFPGSAPWPTEGTHSLQIHPSTNAAFYAESPSGTSGIAVTPGTIVSVSVDATGDGTSSAILNPYVAIEWFTSGGASISVTTGTVGGAVSNAVNDKLKVSGTAPATAAFFAIRAGGSGYSSATDMVIDNVTIGPQMGPQRNMKFTDLLQQCEDVGQGQVFELLTALGLGYRTLTSLRNQSVGLTLDYSSSHLASVPTPTYDNTNTRNDITVSRVNGGTVTSKQMSGALSVLTPPNGVGDYPYNLNTCLNSDTQLPAITSWIQTIGTVDEYRYPHVGVDLSRSEVQSLFSSVPSLGIGDYFQITTPPAWLPSSTIKQLQWGRTETLSAKKWIFDFNGVPESPYEGAGLPTW